MIKRLIALFVVLLVASPAYAAWPTETLWYKLNDNAASTTVVNDGSSTGDGTFQSNTSTKHISGLISGSSGAFSCGTSTNLVTGKSFNTLLSDKTFTINFWVKPTASNELKYVFDHQSGNPMLWFGNAAIGTAANKFSWHKNNEQLTPYATTSALTTNSLYMFTGGYDGDKFWTCLNGGTKVKSGSVSWTKNSNNFELFSSVTTEFQAAADIDDFRVYADAELTDEQIAALYASGSGTEDSLASLEPTSARRSVIVI
jgi:hypothetical protein